MAINYKKDGFLYEKLYITKEVFSTYSKKTYITDIGYFPNAMGHYRERKNGCGEHILILCLSGSGEINNHVVSPNTLSLIPAHSPHFYKADDSNPWEIYWVHVIYENSIPFKDVQTWDLSGHLVKTIKRVFYNMFDSLEFGYNEFSNNFTSLSATYLFHLIELFLKEKVYVPPIIKLVNHYVLEHQAEPLLIDKLCGVADVSKSKLTALYKDFYKLSPLAYLTNVKMEVAANLLISTPIMIKQIANSLGYYDPYYFSRAFKKVYKVSPQQFRKENQ